MIAEVVKGLILGLASAFIWGFATYKFIIKNQDKSTKDPIKAATIVAVAACMFGLFAGMIGFGLMCIEKVNFKWLQRKEGSVYTKEEDNRKLVKNILIWSTIFTLGFYALCFGYGFCKGIVEYTRQEQGYLPNSTEDQDVSNDFVEGKYADEPVQEAYYLVDDLIAESLGNDSEFCDDYRVKVNNGDTILVQLHIPYNKLTDNQETIDEIVNAVQTINNIIIDYLNQYDNTTPVIIEVGDYEAGMAFIRIENGIVTLNNFQ